MYHHRFVEIKGEALLDSATGQTGLGSVTFLSIQPGTWENSHLVLPSQPSPVSAIVKFTLPL